MVSGAIGLTLLAGSATLIGAGIGVIGKAPKGKHLSFALSFAAGMMIVVSFMEMLPSALSTEGVHPISVFLTFIAGLGCYFLLDTIIPHAHAHDQGLIQCKHADRNDNPKLKRVSLLLFIGVTLHNFPEGIATWMSAEASWELGLSIAFAITVHNIPEGLAIAGPIYKVTGNRKKAVFLAGISGFAEILGGLLAAWWLGPILTPEILAYTLAAVAGIMVAISVDELLPLAYQIEPNGHPSVGVLSGLTVMAASLVLLQPAA